MQLFVFIIFLSISIIQTLDYDINNQQICTHRPFKADFSHNCSRTRLIKDVNIPNTNQILYISIILKSSSNINTTLTITKSSTYDQKIYLTFLTIIGRYIYVNNNTTLALNDATINSYLYDTLTEQLTSTIQPSAIPISFLLSNPFCILKQNSSLPPSDISRIYYLYTNETNLHLDLTISSSHISPLFNRFDTCYTVETSLTVLAIILIVIISVLCFVTLVLILIYLKKQLYQLYDLWKNYLRNIFGLNPVVTIDSSPA